ncbi:protein fra10ac1 [Anaeramoeba ignava]|uniref:Protein fra10ac1 n=1 Tax=Anaeramoeba ignava TaxID=1746090 RepID=A0A9Q0LNG4_ANAIG|nr:protein fra10ac1 [Anaeramoeba ignava]
MNFAKIQIQEERKQWNKEHLGMNARERKLLIKPTIQNISTTNPDQNKQNYEEYLENIVTDYDIYKKTYRFIPNQKEKFDSEYESEMAKKYDAKLFKEFGIVDLQFYKQGKMGTRWRIEREVIQGKGETICGEAKCLETLNLQTLEINFNYFENGKIQNALVKIRLCPKCLKKLNVCKQISAEGIDKKLEKKKKKKKKKKRKSNKEKEKKKNKKKKNKKRNKNKNKNNSNNQKI